MSLSIPIFRLKRQAKGRARSLGVPLHQTLDAVAREEGYRSWSHLAATHQQARPGQAIARGLAPGDRVLLGARPGHGKTLLALEILAEASQAGRSAVFFTLEYTAEDVAGRLQDLGYDREALPRLTIDPSDQISASYITDTLRACAPGTVLAIDYLQILDQRRDTPPLARQLAMLRDFVVAQGISLIALSQIDRRYDPAEKSIPDLADLRLPNPFETAVFNKTCFLHDGQVEMRAVP